LFPALFSSHAVFKNLQTRDEKFRPFGLFPSLLFSSPFFFRHHFLTFGFLILSGVPKNATFVAEAYIGSNVCARQTFVLVSDLLLSLFSRRLTLVNPSSFPSGTITLPSRTKESIGMAQYLGAFF
jgi:hypothetical protein